MTVLNRYVRSQVSGTGARGMGLSPGSWVTKGEGSGEVGHECVEVFGCGCQGVRMVWGSGLAQLGKWEGGRGQLSQVDSRDQ